MPFQLIITTAHCRFNGYLAHFFKTLNSRVGCGSMLQTIMGDGLGNGDEWLSWLRACLLWHLSKIQNGQHKQRSGQNTLARQKRRNFFLSQCHLKKQEGGCKETQVKLALDSFVFMMSETVRAGEPSDEIRKGCNIYMRE
jgi:hypothetical protein